MKRISYLFILLPYIGFTQKIVENKIDDFTHHKILRTSWEPFVRRFGGHTIIHTRVSRIDSTLFLDCRIMTDLGVMAINEGGNMLLKTLGDSVITLRNLKYQISCSGCGSVGSAGSGLQGVDLSFPLTPEQAGYLLIHKTLKVRVYTTDGYLEDDVKEKFSDTFTNQIKLVL